MKIINYNNKKKSYKMFKIPTNHIILIHYQLDIIGKKKINTE